MKPTEQQNYREVAKKLGVHYLFGRWGFSIFSGLPGGGQKLRPRIEPLDGWIFDPHEIVEAMANDDAFRIEYKDKK